MVSPTAEIRTTVDDVPEALVLAAAADELSATTAPDSIGDAPPARGAAEAPFAWPGLDPQAAANRAVAASATMQTIPRRTGTLTMPPGR